MTGARIGDPPGPRILSPALALVFAASFGGLTGFFLLLSVVPLYVEHLGGGGVGAGLTTGALMFGTVVAELAMARLVAAFGERVVLGVGLLLLGGFALPLPLTTSTVAILILCTIRGLGFGIVVVAGGAMVAALVPAERRGEGLGLFGIVAGVPGVLALPLGVWLAHHLGYTFVFITGGLVTLVAVTAVLFLPNRPPKAEETLGLGSGLRTPGLLYPALVVLATAVASGAVVTFVPLAVVGSAGGIAALALFVQAVASTAGRWWAGRYGDRHGANRLLVPAVAAAALGILGLLIIDSPVVVLIGMAIFGAGLGVTQNATMATMLNRVSASGYGTVSALWNLAIDVGIGVGSIGFGFLAAQTGYPIAFALMAAVLLMALAPALRDRAIPAKPTPDVE